MVIILNSPVKYYYCYWKVIESSFPLSCFMMTLVSNPEKKMVFELIFSKFDPFASRDFQRKASCFLKNLTVFVSTLKTKN